MPLTQRVRSTARRAAIRTKLARTDDGGATRGTQHLLGLRWKALAERGVFLPLQDVEFRNYSQNGEDGILLYLFTIAGHGTRRAVEVCAGNAIEANATNLVLHHDWDALMLDGDESLIKEGELFFGAHPETHRIGPTLAAEWITRDNIGQILARHGYEDDIDLLSLDMDGMDYWILETLTIRPRIIVLEYNNRIPADRAVTVPYDERFATDAWAGDGYFGAGLAAFDRLLRSREYELVGSNRHNTNAFFVRSDVATELPRVSVDSCLTSRWARHQQQAWPGLQSRPWVET